MSAENVCGANLDDADASESPHATCLRPTGHAGDCCGMFCGRGCRHPNPGEKAAPSLVFTQAELMDYSAAPIRAAWDSPDFEASRLRADAWQEQHEVLTDEIAYARTLARMGDLLPLDMCPPSTPADDMRYVAWRKVLIAEAKAAIKGASESDDLEAMAELLESADCALILLRADRTKLGEREAVEGDA